MLMSPNVAYVRSILLDEMAKGLDSAARLAADAALGQVRSQLRGAISVRSLHRSTLEHRLRSLYASCPQGRMQSQLYVSSRPGVSVVQGLQDPGP